MDKIGLFKYSDFSKFLQSELVRGAQIKRGFKKDLADFMQLHPTSLSQILNQTRLFTEEQIHMLSEFLKLSDLESEYLFVLYQIDKTINKSYKTKLLKKRDSLKNQSMNLSARVGKDKTLTEAEKSIFYSAWYYTAIWVFISLEGGKTKTEIIERFNLDAKTVNLALDFLIKSNLAGFEKGAFHHQVNRTHLESTSAYLKQHHSNWRIRAIEKKDRSSEHDLSFTAPLSLSKKDFEGLREEMVGLIRKVSDTVKNTTAEEIYCLNLDFFEI